MTSPDRYRTRRAPALTAGRILAALLVVLAPVLALAPGAQEFSVQEGILIAKPAVALVTARLGGWTNARLPIEAKSALPSVALELYKHLTLGDLERRHFAKGVAVFREGDDPRGEAFIVHSGTVEVCRRENGALRVLSTLGEGQLVGEMALFRRGTRTADVVAASDVDCWSSSRSGSSGSSATAPR